MIAQYEAKRKRCAWLERARAKIYEETHEDYQACANDDEERDYEKRVQEVAQMECPEHDKAIWSIPDHTEEDFEKDRDIPNRN